MSSTVSRCFGIFDEVTVTVVLVTGGIGGGGNSIRVMTRQRLPVRFGFEKFKPNFPEDLWNGFHLVRKDGSRVTC
jgi:hypothetical protein